MRLFFSFVFAFALLSLPALGAPAKKTAAPKGKAAKPAEEDTSFRVEVPRSELSLPPLAEKTDVSTAEAWSFGASSWAPKDFRRGGFMGESYLRRAGLPYIFAEVSTPLLRLEGSAFNARFGLGYTTLERSGTAAAGGTNFVPVQKLRILQIRIGAEYEAAALLPAVFPYVGFTLLPTFAMAPQSQFEGRVSAFGLPMEGTAGIRIRPAFLSEFWSFRDGALGLGAHYVFGTVDSSRLSGFGGQAYLQVHL